MLVLHIQNLVCWKDQCNEKIVWVLLHCVYRSSIMTTIFIYIIDIIDMRSFVPLLLIAIHFWLGITFSTILDMIVSILDVIFGIFWFYNSVSQAVPKHSTWYNYKYQNESSNKLRKHSMLTIYYHKIYVQILLNYLIFY